MIKRETKYIIRRILISVGVILLLGFIKTCEVRAEVNWISPGDLTYKNPLGSNPVYGTNCSTDGYSCVYLENTNSMTYARFYTGNGGYEFPYSQLAVFNVAIIRGDSEEDVGIGTITLNGTTCYYSATQDYINNQNATSNTENLAPYKTSVSAYCPLSGTFQISGRTKLIEIRYTNGANVSYLMLSRITFISNGEVDRIIQLLGSSNSYWVYNNYLLEEINSKLATIISNEGSITNAINSQSQQQHTDAQAQQQATEDINDSINNSNVDAPNDSINQMQQNLPTNSVISDLLTLPIRMFQNIVNAVNGTCSPFSLGALFGTNLVLPCINIQNYLGSTLWGAIDVIFCGIFILSMRKKFVEIFENITSLKNGGNELE